MSVPLRLLRGLLLGTLLLCSAARADALPSLKVPANPWPQPLAVPHSQLLEDPGARLDAAQAMAQLRSGAGLRLQGDPRLGYSGSVWWLAFSVENPSATALSLLIDNPFV